MSEIKRFLTGPLPTNTYTIKKDGELNIYYRFRISSKKIKPEDTVTPQVTIETKSGKRIFAYTKPGRESRTISFA